MVKVAMATVAPAMAVVEAVLAAVLAVDLSTEMVVATAAVPAAVAVVATVLLMAEPEQLELFGVAEELSPQPIRVTSNF